MAVPAHCQKGLESWTEYPSFKLSAALRTRNPLHPRPQACTRSQIRDYNRWWAIPLFPNVALEFAFVQFPASTFLAVCFRRPVSVRLFFIFLFKIIVGLREDIIDQACLVKPY